MTNDNNTLLERLFANHATGLVRFLSRKVRSREDAEDIAQNAFIRIQRLAESGELENPKAYLYQTAANLAIDQLRREKLHHGYLQSEITKQMASGDEALVNYCTPERLLGAKTQLNAIESALSQLPLKCRQAFLLHRTKGYSYSDIAREMGVSVSSVEKYILQALKHCRKALEDSGGGEL